MGVYYEILNDDSRNFFVEQVKSVLNNVSDTVEFDFVPYADTTLQDGVFFCPSEKDECILNSFQVIFVRICLKLVSIIILY